MLRSIAFLALTGTLATTAAADVVNPLVPGWAGTPGTYTATFNNDAAPFTSAFSPTSGPGGDGNVSDLGSEGPVLYQTNEGAFLTSTGNIYNLQSTLAFELQGTGPVQEAVLNLSTLSFGTSIDFSNVSMYVEAADGTRQDQLADAQLMFIPPGGPPIETSAYVFDWSGIDFEVASWGITFGSAETSSALTGVQVAVNTIPAPGALLGLGLVGAVRRRRS